MRRFGPCVWSFCWSHGLLASRTRLNCVLSFCRDSVDPTRLLLTFNVSVNLGDKYHKNTALHWAVLAGNTTVISLLLDANANVDAQNIKVVPSSCGPVLPYYLSEVQGLISAESVTKVGRLLQGETPLDLAKQRKNVWMINHLQEARQAKGYDSPSYLKRLKMDKVNKQTRANVFPLLFVICILWSPSNPPSSAGVPAEGDAGNTVRGHLAGRLHR